MPIISEIGRKSWSVRALYGVLYLLLILGGITMAYPFLLMVATSTTNYVDYQEYRMVPRYYYEVEARYQKFLYEKYGKAKDYSELHAQEYRKFQETGLSTFAGDPSPATNERRDPITHDVLPPRLVIDADWPHLDARVALWREFEATIDPLEFGVWYVGQANASGKVEILWRDHLRKTYGDLAALNRDLDKKLVAFTEAFAPFEQPDGRLWPGVAGREGEHWAAFKKAVDPRYRRPIDATILYQRFLRYQYQKIEKLNEAFGTTYTDFRGVPLSRTRPSQPAAAKEWEHMVRGELPYRFIAIRDGDAEYRRYLETTFGSLDDVNRNLGTRYASPAEVRWPPDARTPRELDAVSGFLRDGLDVSRPDAVAVASPDKRYAAFLGDKFHDDLAALNAALQAKHASFDDVRPPYEEEDRWEFQQDQGAWMNWFLTQNYREVIDYVAIRGRALWNTLILVGAMILCAVTVNPLAAYALSRFRLGYTNQVLLFLLATMAFPYEVAMIPNFLLMRRFPLWTWLTGLVIGVAVAVIVMRRMEGSRKIIAVPAGFGAAVLGGFYLTPLVARLFGVEVGPVSLLNTFAALILPGMANGYAIFLLKGFFDSLPEELFEAGKIDGASELRMFWQVAFPLSKPIFAVMALQSFTAAYGSYLWALIVCQSDTMWTLMVYIFQLQQWAPQHVTMAATVLASIPTLLVFIFAQKTIMRGIIIPAYK